MNAAIAHEYISKLKPIILWSCDIALNSIIGVSWTCSKNYVRVALTEKLFYLSTHRNINASKIRYRIQALEQWTF